MQSKTITLQEPISHGSETITELAVSAPKAKHMRGLHLKLGGGGGQFSVDLDTGDLVDLAGKLCNVPPSVIDELSFQDFPNVLEAVMSFLPAGLGTGSKA